MSAPTWIGVATMVNALPFARTPLVRVTASPVLFPSNRFPSMT
jgi:hypothetical protein